MKINIVFHNFLIIIDMMPKGLDSLSSNFNTWDFFPKIMLIAESRLFKNYVNSNIKLFHMLSAVYVRYDLKLQFVLGTQQDSYMTGYFVVCSFEVTMFLLHCIVAPFGVASAEYLWSYCTVTTVWSSHHRVAVIHETYIAGHKNLAV